MKDLRRIKTICNYINPFKTIADIGCDHGYLIKEAIITQDITKAYAIDNKIGPLNKAKENLINYPQVKFFLSDGLDKVDNTIEVIIIAGMGGNLIKDILETNIDKLSDIKRIIVQANKDEMIVRKYLNNLNFIISNESIIEEEDKIYEIDVFEKNNIVKYSEDELFFGPILLKNKEELFMKKWNKKYNKFNSIEAYHNDIDKKIILERIKNILCK